MIDAQLQRNTVMTISWMLAMHRLDLLLQLLILGGHLQLTINVLAIDL